MRAAAVSQNLTSVGGQMYMKGNGVLADLSALLSLVSVGSILLVNNGDTLVRACRGLFWILSGGKLLAISDLLIHDGIQ
jgi:hypothetical protein